MNHRHAVRDRMPPGLGRVSLRSSGRALDAHEVSRRVLHMSPGLLPALFFCARSYGYLYLHETLTFVLVTTGMTAIALWFSRFFERPGERSFSVSVIGYAAVALTPLLAFPDDLELGMTALVILAFGDGAASFAGIALDGARIPWNRAKTITGSLTFLSCSIPPAVWTFWALSEPACSFELALFSGVTACIAAALVESLPSRINDNISVGAAATATLVLLRGVLAWR